MFVMMFSEFLLNYINYNFMQITFLNIFVTSHTCFGKIRHSYLRSKIGIISISDQLKLSKNDCELTIYYINRTKTKQKYGRFGYYFMDDITISHLKTLYGLDPNKAHVALQFPRLPPGLFNPFFKVFENPIKKELTEKIAPDHAKLKSFQQAYQRHALGLINMDSSAIIPPSHPLFNQKNSIVSLKTENEKLVKENLELKKRLDKKESNNHQ